MAKRPSIDMALPAWTLQIPLVRQRFGLGDVVARATRAVGIPECGSCKKRRDKLNRLVQFAPPGNRPKKIP